MWNMYSLYNPIKDIMTSIVQDHHWQLGRRSFVTKSGAGGVEEEVDNNS